MFCVFSFLARRLSLSVVCLCACVIFHAIINLFMQLGFCRCRFIEQRVHHPTHRPGRQYLSFLFFGIEFFTSHSIASRAKDAFLFKKSPSKSSASRPYPAGRHPSSIFCTPHKSFSVRLYPSPIFYTPPLCLSSRPHPIRLPLYPLPSSSLAVSCVFSLPLCPLPSSSFGFYFLISLRQYPSMT